MLVEVELVDAAVNAAAGASRRHAPGSLSLDNLEEHTEDFWLRRGSVWTAHRVMYVKWLVAAQLDLSPRSGKVHQSLQQVLTSREKGEFEK